MNYNQEPAREWDETRFQSYNGCLPLMIAGFVAFIGFIVVLISLFG